MQITQQQNKNDASQLIILAQNNKSLIDKKYDEKSKMNDRSENKKYKIKSKYGDQVYEIQKQEYAALSTHEEERKKNENLIQSRIDELYKVPIKISRIIHFLEAKSKKMDFDLTKVGGYRRYGEMLPVKIMDRYDDECLTLGLFLGQCDRKVNNWVLSVAGKSLIGGDKHNYVPGKNVLELERHYGTAIETFQMGGNIENDVKFFPSEQDAIKYAQKHGIKGVMKQFITKYDQAMIEYYKVNEVYTLHDFREYIKKDEKQ